jgi:hypothetical protein
MSISYRPVAKLPMAIAAIAAMSSIPAAAGVIKVTGLNVNVAAGTQYNLDVNQDGSTDVSVANSFYAGVYATVTGVRTTDHTVAPGTLIGPGPKYYDSWFPAQLDYSNQGYLSQPVIGDGVLLPFSFMANSVTDYGWLDLTITNPNTSADPVRFPYEVTLNGYGYDNTGASVVATSAAVPEPSSLLLLAAGFGAVCALRRKAGKAAFTA